MLRASDIDKLRVDKLSISTSLLVRAAREIGLSYQLLPERTVQISDGSRAYFFRGTNLPCTNVVSSIISNNKHLTRKLLRANDVPVPKTIALRNPASWEKVLHGRLKFPLVVKPVTAAHGNGSTMNIQSPGLLRKAVQRAFSFLKKTGRGDRVLVEEFFTGKDLRLMVVGDQVISIINRVPAYVVGDGRHSIKDLIHQHNTEWQSTIHYDYPMCPIPFDAEIGRYLKQSGHRLSSVPAVDEQITLRWNANVSTGGRAFDVTDSVHASLKVLALKCANIIKLPIAGIDMLVKDYRSADTSTANTVVLEINDNAGFDINELPFDGMGRPVSKAILQNIFQIKP